MSRSPALNAMAMTPPRSLGGQAAKAIRLFNPNAKYPIKLADRLKVGSNKSGYTNVRIEIDPNIKFKGSTTEVVVRADPVDTDAVELVVSNKGSSSKQIYRGNVIPQTALYSLTFDQASQTLVLDRVENSMTFSTDRPASSGSDISASDSEGYGSPDPDNPYDFRHQLKRRSSSPLEDDTASAFSGVDSRTASPALPPKYPSRPRASTPPGSMGGTPMARGGSQTTAVSTPSRTSDVEIDFDDGDERRRNGHKSRSNLVRKQKSYDSEEDGDQEGPFQIIPDGSEPERGRPQNNSVRPDEQPRSLVSMISSRSRSRQSMADQQSTRKKQQENENRRRGQDADIDGLEIELDRSPTPKSHKSFADNVSDGGISDMDVGPPVRTVSKSKADQEAFDRQFAASPSPAASDDFQIEPEPEPEPELGRERELESDDNDGFEIEPEPDHVPEPGLRPASPLQQKAPINNDDGDEDDDEDDFAAEFEEAFDADNADDDVGATLYEEEEEVSEEE